MHVLVVADLLVLLYLSVLYGLQLFLRIGLGHVHCLVVLLGLLLVQLLVLLVSLHF